MALIRINPTKILVGGDKEKAKSFIGPARSQLNILKQNMSFQKLKQGIRKIWLNSDVYVECRQIFDYQECKIWVRPIEAIIDSVDQEVYFYIHFKFDLSSLAGPVEGPAINRLILWRMRKEEKTDVGKELSKDIEDYIDHGEYTDGRKWGITDSGAIILDVD